MQKLDVITIGETMAVFNPMQDLPFTDAHLFMKQIGGAESNFAIGLSRLGHKTGWISRLSNDSLGYFIHNTIRGNGVDTSFVQFDDHHPTGLLIKERLIQNQVNVHYYRKNSAASHMTKEIINEEYFSQSKYLFVTGITPVLSASCRDMIFEAITVAKRNGIKIIFDPNIRFKLCSDKNEYRNLLNHIANLSDYFLPGIEEAKFLTGLTTPEEIANYYINLKTEITVVIKLGSKGCFYANSLQSNYVAGLKVDKVNDPIGAGDAFAAGFVSGLLEGKNLELALEKANLIGALVVQTNGDIEGFPYRKQLDEYQKFMIEPSGDEVHR
nr:sugar kinase [Fredinandcohnia onubensis]